MPFHGPDTKQNPIARALFVQGGPITLAIGRAASLAFGASAVRHVAYRCGRSRLARACLGFSILLMLLGVASTLV